MYYIAHTYTKYTPIAKHAGRRQTQIIINRNRNVEIDVSQCLFIYREIYYFQKIRYEMDSEFLVPRKQSFRRQMGECVEQLQVVHFSLCKHQNGIR